MNAEKVYNSEQTPAGDDSPWGEAYLNDLPPFNLDQMETDKDTAEITAEKSLAEKAVAETVADFERITAMNREHVARTQARIEMLKQKLAAETDEWRKERYEQQLRDREAVLRKQAALVEFARIPTVEDVEYRHWAKTNFADLVRGAVPDELPLVFHGTNNLGNVRSIIQSHGLLTPEQRNESMTSFAAQVDVTSKTNIQTSCDFAESNYKWLPYGAIFAFLPKPEEVAEVRKTEASQSSEVFGGVDGVDFKEQPERLYGIITTPENIERIQAWCQENHLDSNKVMTHGDFLATVQAQN